MEEGESIELLTITGHYAFRMRLGSQPQHPPLKRYLLKLNISAVSGHTTLEASN